MAVRVRIEIETLKGKKAETVALVNTGYESEDVEITIPIRFAEKLNLWPELPEGSRIEEYGSVAGIVKLYWIPNCAQVKILTGEKVTKPIICHVAISEFEREVLLSDKIAGAFRIVIEDIKTGDWRLQKEKKIRKSEKPQRW